MPPALIVLVSSAKILKPCWKGGRRESSILLRYSVAWRNSVRYDKIWRCRILLRYGVAYLAITKRARLNVFSSEI